MLLERINNVLNNIHYLKDIFLTKNIDNKLIFASPKEDKNDFFIVGNRLNKNKLIFALEINPKHDAFKVVEQIQFNLYLDQTNKILSAGFSFNWGNASIKNSFEDLLKKVYETNLLSFFINKEFYNLPISDWDTQWLLEFNRIWEKWLRDKVSQDLEMNLNFQALIKLLMVVNIVQYEIKTFFKLGVNAISISDPHRSHLLHLNNKIKNDFCLTKPFISYEIIRDSEQPFLDEDDDIFLNNKYFKLLYLIMINPEVFGITSRYSRLVSFRDLVNNIEAYEVTKNINDIIDNLVDETICEWNYDYVTFINKDLTSLIVKNNNPVNPEEIENPSILYELDANRKVFNLYFWSIIFVQTKIMRLIAIDNKISDKSQKQKSVVVFEASQQVNNLKFSFDNNYYGMPSIKKITKKMLCSIESDNFFNKLDQKINNGIVKAHLDKRVKNTVYALIVALIFGLFDFLNTVFTVLDETHFNETHLGTAQIVVIVISSLFALILVVILIQAAISGGVADLIKSKWKKRKEKKHE